MKEYANKEVAKALWNSSSLRVRIAAVIIWIAIVLSIIVGAVFLIKSVSAQTDPPFMEVEIPTNGVAHIDTRNFPNGLVNYRTVDSVTGEVTTGSFTVQNSPLQQIAPITDPYVIRNIDNGTIMREIYLNDSTQIIEYRESDLVLDTVILTRTATATEAGTYNFSRASEIADAAVVVSTSNLQSDPNYLQFVTNQTANLISCEADMITGQARTFNSLGNGAQNVTIARMQECIELNAFVLKKMLPNLYDLLVAEGIIVVAE